MEAEILQVVVYTEQGSSVGLIVDDILDIVDQNLELQREVGEDGVIGSAIVQGQVTDVLDVRSLVNMLDPTLFGAVEAA